jgi:Ca2+-binding EF-hand superfamily protein
VIDILVCLSFIFISNITTSYNVDTDAVFQLFDTNNDGLIRHADLQTVLGGM